MNGFMPVQFGFVVLFCISFGNRSERPLALQLLIKMMLSEVGGAFPFIAKVLV